MVVVQSVGSKLFHKSRAGDFEVLADEPLALGGENLGPTPYDLLLTALGSCMSMTMLMYARRKGWPLESLEVKLNHNRTHAKDCEDCETKSGMLDHITVSVSLVGNLDQSQRQRILEIGSKCPVHNTLTKEVIITSEA